jgi:hypothetical protein
MSPKNYGENNLVKKLRPNKPEVPVISIIYY